MDRFVEAQMVSRPRREDRGRERLAEFSFCRAKAKHKGRNHWRNWERRMMAAAKKSKAKAKAEKRAVEVSGYLDEARSYWRGDRPDLPAKPL